MSRPGDGGRRLHMVAVCHQLQPQDFAARLLALALRSGIRLRGVVVGNNATHPRPSSTSGLHFIRGSNELLDFSGFFEGQERLLSLMPDVANDNLLFVNDTLFSKHAAGCILGRVLGLDGLMQQLQLPAIGGKMYPYRSICLRNPWSGLPGFITSFCFLLNARALPTMQQLKADAIADGVFADADLSDSAWGCAMPADFREFIRAHLTYPDSPYLWPSAASSDATLLRKKASCVYFEGRLSGAIAAAGAMVPINAGLRACTDIFVQELGARAWRALAVVPR